MKKFKHGGLLPNSVILDIINIAETDEEYENLVHEVEIMRWGKKITKFRSVAKNREKSKLESDIRGHESAMRCELAIAKLNSEKFIIQKEGKITKTVSTWTEDDLVPELHTLDNLTKKWYQF